MDSLSECTRQGSCRAPHQARGTANQRPRPWRPLSRLGPAGRQRASGMGGWSCADYFIRQVPEGRGASPGRPPARRKKTRKDPAPLAAAASLAAPQARPRATPRRPPRQRGGKCGKRSARREPQKSEQKVPAASHPKMKKKVPVAIPKKAPVASRRRIEPSRRRRRRLWGRSAGTPSAGCRARSTSSS